MKILLAGATGVVGRRLIPLLVQAGHEVAGTTRRSERAGMLRELGASPVVLDVLNTGDVRAAVAAIDPDAVIHQLTDLADEDFEANSHLRIAGTRNLVDAAKAAGVETMVAQSIAWLYVPGDAPAVETDPLDANLPPYEGIAALESAVSEMPHGVVLRYGALYGPAPGTRRTGRSPSACARAACASRRPGRRSCTPTTRPRRRSRRSTGPPEPSTSSTTSRRPRRTGCPSTARRSARRRRATRDGTRRRRGARPPTPRR
ncbi:NAD(P)-dependent oxidoreductase [Actinomadura madurae]|uniref:NAD-dependent epimerase/dehydratase family protein n=1 Tax=Actinomadura madurae TaxID=1993 RepID=UPI0020D23C82|nr:NAD(P)-dependent oxidoreductase [Actinomadura madurae]MCP9953166.1 NAD(P)-dependent oxidoreductase [Actinomadura madurae]